MTSRDVRVAFMGTAAFGAPALRAMCAHGYKPVVLYTQPPRPAGRGQKPRPTDMANVAQELGIPIETPKSLRTADALETFQSYKPDIAIVAAYGLILPRQILDAPRLGCVNIHASLLPRWRGAAPIQRAIMAGDTTSGISLFQMDEGLDTGDVYEMKACAIGDRWTAADLHDGLAAMAAEMMPVFLDQRLQGKATATVQPEDGACYAQKIRKEEGLINWADDCLMIDRQLRGLTPWPGCFTTLPDGHRLNIVSGVPQNIPNEGDAARPGTIVDHPLVIASGRGQFDVQMVKAAGRKMMTAQAFMNGASLKTGDLISA